MRLTPALTRPLLAAALLAGTTGVATLVAPTPAPAVPGLTTVEAVSPLDSTATKSVTAACPAGTTVVGGGGKLGSDSSHLLLTGLRPLWTLFGTGYQVTGSEDEAGYGGGWQVWAYATCAPDPAGLQYRWASTGGGSQAARDMAVTCPEGRKVLGTGAVVTGGGQQVALRRVRPTADLRTVFVGAHEDANGYAGSWSLTAWAVCADPVPGQELRFDATNGQGFALNSAQAVCPAPKRIHGVGGMIIDGEGQVSFRGLFPHLGTTGFVQGALDEPGYAGPWLVYAFAICAY
jgi:hypothetical protein